MEFVVSVAYLGRGEGKDGGTEHLDVNLADSPSVKKVMGQSAGTQPTKRISDQEQRLVCGGINGAQDAQHWEQDHTRRPGQRKRN